ncbi:hypothetical protein KUF71_020172, partial [Frankliniella fusca]
GVHRHYAVYVRVRVVSWTCLFRSVLFSHLVGGRVRRGLSPYTLKHTFSEVAFRLYLYLDAQSRAATPSFLFCPPAFRCLFLI